MFTFITKLLNYIPQPYRVIVQIGAAVLFIALVIYLFGSIRSCQYDKARREYQQAEAHWKAERDGLKGENALLRTQIAELEPKVLAYQAAADAGRKVDENLAAKIEQIGKDSANEEAMANTPTDCRTRAARVCALLSTNRIPHDCGAITRESCSR